jgi:sterol desaturase/sphingolipid hydroxylase (fatty acid hydroxylase superfamily)
MKTSENGNRVFENEFLEKFSKTNAYVVIIAYIVIATGIFIYFSLASKLSVFFQISLFFAGLICFSFTEYMVHRYLFHSSKSSDEANFSYRLHHIHHDHPGDKKRLALPLPVGLVVASVLYFIFWLLLRQYTPFFFPGFIIGYALYLLIHYLIHTRRPPNNIFKILWRNHNIHHFKDDTKAYGVTSPFWDILFRTTP